MYILQSSSKDNFELNNYSSTLEQLNDICEENVFPIPYSNEIIEELINIHSLKKLNEETFRLIDFLDMNYLLYNNEIELNSSIPSIIELYDIKNTTDNIIKLHKMINYFRANIDYIVFDHSLININKVCEYGYINILDWFVNSGKEFKYTKNAINWACCNGHVNILDWFVNSGKEFKYTEDAINWACRNGRVNILDWFVNSGKEFKYTKDAIKLACWNGHVNILDWFVNSGKEFKYTEDAIKWACCNGHVNILDWFVNSGKEFKYSTRVREHGRVNVLEWFEKNENILKQHKNGLPDT